MEQKFQMVWTIRNRETKVYKKKIALDCRALLNILLQKKKKKKRKGGISGKAFGMMGLEGSQRLKRLRTIIQMITRFDLSAVFFRHFLARLSVFAGLWRKRARKWRKEKTVEKSIRNETLREAETLGKSEKEGEAEGKKGNVVKVRRLFTCELPFLTKEHHPPFLNSMIKC